MSRRDGAIYVGRLSKSTRTRDLEEIFEPYGRLLRCDIKYGTEMAYAFIDFEDRRDAEDCVKYEHGRELNGQSIIVEWAKGGKDRRMKRNDNNSSQSYDECFRCRRTGHWARDCPELRWGGRGGGRGGGGGGGGRWRSPSPRRRYSNRSRSRSRDRKRKSRSRSRDRRRRSRSNDKRSRSRSGDRKSRSLSGSQKSRSASPGRKDSKSTSRDRKKSGSRSKSRSRSRTPQSKSGSKSKSRSKSPRQPSENHTEQQSNGADVVANVDEEARDGGDEGRASRSRSGSKD
ncbi:serine/arginine-rich splicing factor 4-like isoform X1 [Physella acuta]|uniref:serine/arginine-rich splicing factor 4-like isoform X1 n=1 Tax=Physella acuta TaxID=109671 RepID=UPI0027DE2A60|nr:serine/arginine-rich splicing factor 4-like isoform X1 [Physella acuta]